MIKAILNKGQKRRGRPDNPNAKWRKIYAMIDGDNSLAKLSPQKLAQHYRSETGDTCDPVTAWKAQVTWNEHN